MTKFENDDYKIQNKIRIKIHEYFKKDIKIYCGFIINQLKRCFTIKIINKIWQNIKTKIRKIYN